MKTYKIAYRYVTRGEVNVEAESLEQAKELAYEASLQPNLEYMDDSTFVVDEEVTDVLNQRNNIVC